MKKKRASGTKNKGWIHKEEVFCYTIYMKQLLISDKEKLIKVLRQNHIIFAALFGSRAKGNARPDSDYDFLVEFDPTQRVGYFKFFDIERNIQNYLGLPVDIITTKGTNKRLHAEIDQTKVVLYDERKQIG